MCAAILTAQLWQGQELHNEGGGKVRTWESTTGSDRCDNLKPAFKSGNLYPFSYSKCQLWTATTTAHTCLSIATWWVLWSSRRHTLRENYYDDVIHIPWSVAYLSGTMSSLSFSCFSFFLNGIGAENARYLIKDYSEIMAKLHKP